MKRVAEQVRIIRRTLVQSMNGVVSTSMEQRGIHYTRNYGVELPRLRSIAAQFQPSLALSNALWLIDTRETRMLSLLLFPQRYLTSTVILSRLSSITTVELLEFAAQNLFSHKPLTPSLRHRLLLSPDPKCQACYIYMLSSSPSSSAYQQLLPLITPSTFSSDYTFYAFLFLVRQAPISTLPALLQQLESTPISHPRYQFLLEELRTRILYS